MHFTPAFDRNMTILQKSLDVSLLRYNVIANNIANSETPNFKRSVVNFEAQLKRALDAEKVKPAFPGKLKYRRGVSFFTPKNVDAVQPKVVLDYLTTAKNNGNNVDIDEEMMNAVSTQLEYQTILHAVNNEFMRLNMVLR
ncbi:MAG: flagellar basal body rod protein FlgB [Spirochaetia bacterium]|jgi:flagellar basal-body rod protein FlgB